MFLDQLDRREILFGSGDALDVEIMYKQSFDVRLRERADTPVGLLKTT
jgi:hypothetical protein